LYYPSAHCSGRRAQVPKPLIGKASGASFGGFRCAKDDGTKAASAATAVAPVASASASASATAAASGGSPLRARAWSSPGSADGSLLLILGGSSGMISLHGDFPRFLGRSGTARAPLPDDGAAAGAAGCAEAFCGSSASSSAAPVGAEGQGGGEEEEGEEGSARSTTPSGVASTPTSGAGMDAVAGASSASFARAPATATSGRPMALAAPAPSPTTSGAGADAGEGASSAGLAGAPVVATSPAAPRVGAAAAAESEAEAEEEADVVEDAAAAPSPRPEAKVTAEGADSPPCARAVAVGELLSESEFTKSRRVSMGRGVGFCGASAACGFPRTDASKSAACAGLWRSEPSSAPDGGVHTDAAAAPEGTLVEQLECVER